MRRFALLALFALMLAITGCGGGGDSDSKADNKKADDGDKKMIGVSLMALDNPFFKVIADELTKEASKNGYEVVVVSADKDVAKQSNQVKDFIVKKCAAIVLSPCESNAIGPIIKEANKAGIPIFTVDVPCRRDDIKIASQVHTDNKGGGKLAGQAMIEVLGKEGGKVAILHFPQAESCLLRVEGFKEVIDKHNEVAKNKIEIVAELESGGAKDVGRKAAADVIQRHQDLKGIFAINDPAALGAYAALKAANKAEQVTIVGFDGQPEGKQAIKEGKIYADPIQFPDKMGKRIAQYIQKYYDGEEIPKEELIPTSLYKKEDAMKDPELK